MMESFYPMTLSQRVQLHPSQGKVTAPFKPFVLSAGVYALILLLWVPGIVAGQPTEKGATAVPTTAFLDTLDVSVVNLEVFVTDRKGQPILDLRREDFEVFQDGEPVELSHFVAPDASVSSEEMAENVVPPESAGVDSPAADLRSVPSDGPDISLGSDKIEEDLGRSPETQRAHVVIFVDQLEISPHNRRRVLDQVETFVDQEAADTRFLVAAYDGQIKILQELTSDTTQIAAALDEFVKLSPRALARQSERRALLREGQEVLRTIGEAVNATNASQFRTARSLAQSQLTSLMGQVERYAQRLQSETERGVAALEEFTSSLAALPGRKALVHVSEGIAMRPGQELFFAMEEIFKGGRSLDFGNQGNSDGGQGGQGEQGGQAGGQGGQGQGGGGPSFESDESLNVISFTTRAERFSLSSAFYRLAALANTHQVTFYGIDARGSRATGRDASVNGRIGLLATDGMQAISNSNRWETLEVLAEETGGRLLTGADVDGFLAKARSDFSAHYSLAYSPLTPGDGKTHKIKVRLRRDLGRRLRRARLRYRQSFVDQSLAVRMAARTVGSLLLDSDRNPHGIYLETLEPSHQEEKTAVIPIVVKIPLSQVTLLPQGKSHGCQARLLVAVEDENGFTGPVQEIPFVIEIPNKDLAVIEGQDYSAGFELVLEPGTRRRLAVGFWDETGGEGSFVRHDVVAGEL